MDFSRCVAAPRPGLQIGGGAGPFRGTCSLRRTRHRGGDGAGGNLMVASTLHGCGLFYASPMQGTSLALRHRGAPRCQGNDSLAYVDGPLEGTKGSLTSADADESTSGSGSDADEKSRAASAAAATAAGNVDDLRDALQRARKELEVARLNSTMFEGKAQCISESAIALKDRADGAQGEVSATVATVQEIIGREDDAKEAMRKATIALSMAEARLQLAVEALDTKRGSVGQLEVSLDDVEEEALVSAQEEIKGCQASLSKCEEELRRVQGKKAKLQKEVDSVGINLVASGSNMNRIRTMSPNRIRSPTPSP